MRYSFKYIPGLIIVFILFAGVLIAQETEKADSIVNVNNLTEIPASVKKIAEAIDKVKEQAANAEPVLEIDGLVVNETRTKIGRDFYDAFYNNWVAPANASNYTIIMQELPYRGINTQIMVFVNENLIYQGVLMPRFDYVEEMVVELNMKTTQYLQYYQEILQSLDNEDMSGSGIY